MQPILSKPLMTYAELKFILSEYNGFSVDDYREGVEASIAYWSAKSGVEPCGTGGSGGNLCLGNSCFVTKKWSKYLVVSEIIYTFAVG